MWELVLGLVKSVPAAAVKQWDQGNFFGICDIFRTGIIKAVDGLN